MKIEAVKLTDTGIIETELSVRVKNDTDTDMPILSKTEIEKIHNQLLLEFNTEIDVAEKCVREYQEKDMDNNFNSNAVKEHKDYTWKFVSEKKEDIYKRHGDYIKLLKDKNQLIRTILGNFYNGVLINDSLSIRKGSIFEFRKQYPCSLRTFKKRVSEHLQEISQKLNDKQLAILEFCMDKIIIDGTDDDYDNYKKEFFNVKGIDQNKHFIVNEDDGNFKLNKVGNIRITNHGDIDITEYRYNYRDYGTKIILYYKKEIEQGFLDYIKELDDSIDKLNKEIETIKDKGGDYIALAELTGNKGKEYYGE